MIKFDEQSMEVLTELEKTQHEFWNISHPTAMFLNMLIKISKAKSAIEVGTSNGYSAIWLAKALQETGGHLTTIEFYEKRQSVAIENFKKCGVSNIITPKLGRACDILHDIDFEIDFAFVDANKSEYVRYFEYIDKHLVQGGIIACDNVLSHEEKVKPFVDKIKADPRYQVEILDLPAGLLLGYKTA